MEPSRPGAVFQKAEKNVSLQMIGQPLCRAGAMPWSLGDGNEFSIMGQRSSISSVILDSTLIALRSRPDPVIATEVPLLAFPDIKEGKKRKNK